MYTDPISDMLTRIRNANTALHPETSMPSSKIKEEILKTLHREGYIAAIDIEGEGTHKQLKITLKYGPEGEYVINEIQRVSKPGRRVYRQAKDLSPLLGGLGIWVLSTPRGILSDNEARLQKVGGEVLCSVH